MAGHVNQRYTPVPPGTAGYLIDPRDTASDVLHSLIVNVTDDTACEVTIYDGTSHTIVPIGTAVGLHVVELGIRSKQYGWQIATGGGVSVTAVHGNLDPITDPTAIYETGVYSSFLLSDGGLYVLSPENMYIDRAGTTNVTADGELCGNITDSSGNGYTLVSPSDAARATYKTSGGQHWIQLDKLDDNYSTTFASNIVGTMLIGTRKGTIHLEVDIPAGPWSLTPDPAYFPGNTVTDIIIKDGYMTDAELANAKAWLASRGSPVVYAPTGLDLNSAFRARGAEITKCYTDTWNTSGVSGNGLAGTFFGCTGITSLDISDFDLRTNASVAAFAYFCTNLTTINVGAAFDNSPCTIYNNAFFNCALDQSSVDAILHSIRTAYETLSLSGGNLGLDGGTNATPSAAGKADADYLRAQGMIVDLNGYPA